MLIATWGTDRLEGEETGEQGRLSALDKEGGSQVASLWDRLGAGKKKSKKEDNLNQPREKVQRKIRCAYCRHGRSERKGLNKVEKEKQEGERKAEGKRIAKKKRWYHNAP